MMGTSIQELQAAENQGVQYNAMSNLQYEQAHGAAHHGIQAQHAPYNNVPENYGYPNPGNPSAVYASDNRMADLGHVDHMDMDILAQDMNNDMTMDPSLLIAEDEGSGNNSNVLGFLPKQLVDPLIILGLFVLLSHPAARTFIGDYIKQTRPGASGQVSMTGVIIYGILLATLFALIKKFIVK